MLPLLPALSTLEHSQVNFLVYITEQNFTIYMTASISSLCSRWLWQPFPELLVMLSGITQNKISMTKFPVFTFTLTEKEVQKHTHAQTQKDYFHFDKLQKGCTSMLCGFCQGNGMNFMDPFIADNPFSKHLLCFPQSQKHTTFICKGSGHYSGPSLRGRRHYGEAETKNSKQLT